MLIDTHCHLNFPDKFPDPAEVVEESKGAGVVRLIAVGCDSETSRNAVALAEQFEEVYAVVGWHPTYTSAYTRESLDEIEQMAKHPKVVAIGEIGLDFHWDYSTPEQQKVALFEQLDLAVRTEMPVVFHCREAYSQLLDILEERPIHPYLFHCFAGDVADAARAVELGCCFGVDGPLTYKNAQALRDTIRSIPADRIVIETDCPYLPPVPFRGKPNKPAYVRYICDALAELLGISQDECANLTTRNALKFFRMELPGNYTAV
jgi:TatD DNase family protein